MTFKDFKEECLTFCIGKCKRANENMSHPTSRGSQNRNSSGTNPITTIDKYWLVIFPQKWRVKELDIQKNKINVKIAQESRNQESS